MVRFLIDRPIAVIMTFVVLIVFGLLALKELPISLLPNIDVPQLIIKINYPNTAAAAIEENIIKPVRENLSTLQHIKDVETISTNHIGTLYLTFEYGTRMDLVYIDVNEKLDRITNSLPKDMTRPQVLRINTSDIPIAHIQVVPKNTKDFLQVSELTEKVIKKRIEQIDGVSLVDINGKQNSIISINPDQEKLVAFGLSEALLAQAISEFNHELGAMSVKDGQYRYFVRLANPLENIKDLWSIPIKTNNSVIQLREVASIIQEPEQITGLHLFNGKQGLVITVHKQAESRMNELVPKIHQVIQLCAKDYPQIDFAITQDQTFILNAGIDNLNQDLIYGGILCVLLLFMFLGNYATPTLMSISIPSSLVLTFIFFYLFDISLNIISLSGLALGIGMLIDNSIVVLDSITRKRRSGLPMDESCEKGVNEVMVPVISQVLTTIAVYAPLVYLSGLAGALVYDQAIALTISLCVSLGIAFFLNPVLYKLFLKADPEKLKEDTIFYIWVSKRYHLMMERILSRKKSFFIFTIILMPIGFILMFFIPIANLPQTKNIESLVKVEWNESIDIQESKRRILKLMTNDNPEVDEWEADLGIKQFLLQQENSDVQKTDLYYKCKTSEGKEGIDQLIKNWFKTNYPRASIEIQPAPNAFTQLFENRNPYFEARFRASQPHHEHSFEGLESIIQSISEPWSKGKGFTEEQNIEMIVDNNKLFLYKVDFETLRLQLERIFGHVTISKIKRFGEVRAIRFKSDREDIQSQLQKTIMNKDGITYPLQTFINYRYDREPKYITSDRSGPYKSIVFDQAKDIENIKSTILQAAIAQNMTVDFKGRYFNSQEDIKDVAVIFILSVLLLYFILAVQFENLVHPFLVMLTMPLGLAGAMALLFLTGGTLDIMAAIGFVVVLGIVVDDPILKVETINRLRRQYELSGLSKTQILEKAIYESGEICLKPLLMTSLTTSLALLPILFTGGIGSDLQKPLVWVIVGGLTIGTFFTLWFIPLAYWFITKKD